MENDQLTENLVTLVSREGAWRVLAVPQGMSPAELLNAASVKAISPRAKKQLELDLSLYRLEIEQCVDDAIADNTLSPGDREAKIDELWNSSVMYKKDLGEYFSKGT